MTTFTTSGITFPQSTTITLQHEERSVTITTREYTDLRELFYLFQAAIAGVGFVDRSYQDMLCQLADEFQESQKWFAAQNKAATEDDDTDDA